MKKQPTRRATKAKKAPQLTPPVTEPSPDEVEAATALGMSPMVLRLLAAAGVMPPDLTPYDYLEAAGSLAEVGVAFDVSERTAATWKAKGMPVNADGSYPLATIRYWRLQQQEPPDWLVRGNKNLHSAEATGDLGRAVLRRLRRELPGAIHAARADFLAVLAEVDRSDDDALDELLTGVMARHLEGFLLTDAVIEELIVEAWGRGLT